MGFAILKRNTCIMDGMVCVKGQRQDYLFGKGGWMHTQPMFETYPTLVGAKRGMKALQKQIDSYKEAGLEKFWEEQIIGILDMDKGVLVK